MIEKQRKKRTVAIGSLLVIVGFFSLFTIFLRGATLSIEWLQVGTLGIDSESNSNLAADDEILLEFDVSDNGKYVLEYYLEDGRKTTATFFNRSEQMDISYKVQGYNAIDPATPIELTQSLIDLSYREVDYSLQDPIWKFDDEKEVDPLTNALEFSIIKSASSQYSRVSFEVDNKMFIAKWDFVTNTMRVLINRYQNGKLMPFTLTNPSLEQKTIRILKSLEEFNTDPTYLVDDGGVNVELTPVVHPNADGYKPGNRPGLKVSFKQPKDFDPSTWTYTYDLTNLQNVKGVFFLTDNVTGSVPDRLSFDFFLQNSTVAGLESQRINNIPIENGDQSLPANQVNYQYDPLTHTYEIFIVQDKSILNDQDSIVQWNKLAGSKIYNAEIRFEKAGAVDASYKFDYYRPLNKFAYTYLEYTINRIDKQEAFLQIKPYLVGERMEYTVLYSTTLDVGSTSLDPVRDLWIRHYQSSTDTSELINIPVVFFPSDERDFYQVVVDFSGVDLKSQVLNYQSIYDKDIPPSTPQIESIDNIYVVPPIDDSTEDPTKIQFDLTWEAVENRENGNLDEVFANTDLNPNNDSVFYEVLVSDVPEEGSYEVFRVYEIYKEDGRYKLRVHSATGADDVPYDDGLYYRDGYNSINELLRMTGISIYENGAWTNRINTVYDKENHTYSVTEAGEIDQFTFPGVNYLRMRCITVTDGFATASAYSYPVSLSLSMMKYEIPVVEAIQYEPFYSLIDTDPSGLSVNFPAIDIRAYEEYMLLPISKKVDDDEGVIYRVYLSGNKEVLLDLDEEETNYIEVIPTPLTGESLIEIGQSELEALRNVDATDGSNIIYFDIHRDKTSSADIDFDLQGLDLNDTYFLRVAVLVDVFNTHLGTNEPVLRRGIPSSILSMTTPVVPPEPGEEELFPLVPSNFTAAFYDESQLAAKLQWNIPSGITLGDDEFGFEVFSIEDMRLPDDLSLKTTGILDIMQSNLLENKVIEAFRIYYEGTGVVMKKYDRTTGTWINQSSDLFTINDASVQMIDDNNSPNRVNYYYVRTVNINQGAVSKSSSWVLASLTTAPIKGPINLMVDYDSIYPYDRKYETMLRFDAPIPSDGIVGTNYLMEIFIKGEDDADYKQALVYTGNVVSGNYYMALTAENAEGPIGYRRLFYRIYGLRPGKTYDIKVRIEDRTKPIEVISPTISGYPKSPFSEIITTRTDFSQEDYDKELKYQQYIEYYLKKAEELKQNPYYLIRQDSNSATIKYRLNYADGLLKLNQGGTFSLVAMDKKTNIYYLPAELIETANNNSVTLTIEPSSQYIGILPYTIGKQISSEINQMITSIQAYGSVLKDYYVKIILSVGEYSGTINGMKPSSPLIDIQMSIVGSKKTEADMEIALEAALDTTISNRKNTLIQKLEAELSLGINDVKLTKIVQDVLELVKTDFYVSGQNALSTNMATTESQVKKLNKPMTIGLVTSNTTDHVLYSKTVGDWKVESGSYYNNRYNIQAAQLGSYISLTKTNSSSLAQLYTSEQISLINKYLLNEVFTNTTLNKPESSIYNVQMIRTLSRMLGAPLLNDGVEYLTSLGVQVPTLSDYANLNRLNAYYVYVQAYAKKKQINLNTVVIKNYNAIEDLATIPSAYRNTLLRGVSLGIIPLEQSQIMKDKAVTIGDFLKLIENLE